MRAEAPAPARHAIFAAVLRLGKARSMADSNFGLTWPVVKPPADAVLTVLLIGLGSARSFAGPAGVHQPSAQAERASQPTRPAVAEPAELAKPDPGTVHGRAGLPNGNSLRGLRVSIGEQSTFTAGDGRFDFRNVPATYDLNISESNGRFVTAYFGLTRRDPIVTHTARSIGMKTGERYQATILGGSTVDGFKLDQTFSAGRVVRPEVYFFSPSTFAKNSSNLPLYVRWGGCWRWRALKGMPIWRSCHSRSSMATSSNRSFTMNPLPWDESRAPRRP